MIIIIKPRERMWSKKPQNYIICPQCEYKIVLEITR